MKISMISIFIHVYYHIYFSVYYHICVHLVHHVNQWKYLSDRHFRSCIYIYILYIISYIYVYPVYHIYQWNVYITLYICLSHIHHLYQRIILHNCTLIYMMYNMMRICRMERNFGVAWKWFEAVRWVLDLKLEVKANYIRVSFVFICVYYLRHLIISCKSMKISIVNIFIHIYYHLCIY